MTKTRECGTKQRHATKWAAKAHVWSLVKRTGTRPGAMAIYRCKHCGDWHVGHAKRRR